MDQLEVIVASDGSTDRTAAIVREFDSPNVRLLEFPESRGRAAVHNDAVKTAGGDILVFTDAATRFDPDFLLEIAADFGDERVGCVSGDVIYGNRRANRLTQQRGLYWRFECWLRRSETVAGIFACASGPAMAVRKKLFVPLADSTYDVDFITPLDVVEAGYLALQEPRAVAFDEMFETPAKEMKAQVRMVSRNIRGYAHRRCMFGRGPFWAAWGLFSHKVLRWLTPFAMAVLFVVSTVLALQAHAVVPWILQFLFYLAALMGWLLTRAGKTPSFFAAPYAFCVANVGFLMGVWKYLRNERIVVY